MRSALRFVFGSATNLVVSGYLLFCCLLRHKPFVQSGLNKPAYGFSAGSKAVIVPKLVDSREQLSIHHEI
jgi:hypothetical protein